VHEGVIEIVACCKVLFPSELLLIGLDILKSEDSEPLSKFPTNGQEKHMCRK